MIIVTETEKAFDKIHPFMVFKKSLSTGTEGNFYKYPTAYIILKGEVCMLSCKSGTRLECVLSPLFKHCARSSSHCNKGKKKVTQIVKEETTISIWLDFLEKSQEI